jgi:hypothetical protein
MNLINTVITTKNTKKNIKFRVLPVLRGKKLLNKSRNPRTF